MTPEDANAWSLARLNTLFFHHYDRREYDEVVELFTPDARYEVHGQKLRDHAEILDVLNARPGPELTAATSSPTSTSTPSGTRPPRAPSP
jgi:hypothetical protein